MYFFLKWFHFRKAKLSHCQAPSSFSEITSQPHFLLPKSGLGSWLSLWLFALFCVQFLPWRTYVSPGFGFQICTPTPKVFPSSGIPSKFQKITVPTAFCHVNLKHIKLIISKIELLISPHIHSQNCHIISF